MDNRAGRIENHASEGVQEMIRLRSYQQSAVESVFREWKSVQSTLGVAATGSGKTTIFSEVVRRMQPKRAMIVAHREELIFQAKNRIESQVGIECELEMAQFQATTSLFHRTPVVVATIQTLISGGKKRRIDRFAPNDFGLLIVDEAHHGTAASYKVIIEHFKQNPDLKILGVTATPDRGDEEALGQMFQSVAFEYDILDAVRDGWLVEPMQQFVSIEGLDFSEVRTTAGELNGTDLAAVMESEKTLHGVTGASIQIIGNRRTIVFTASVRQAEMACEIFNRHKSGMAGWICGKTDKQERRRIMASFANGDLQVMCNVGCLTEGVDVPAAEVCIMGRPTESRSLYAQMAGRIMRPYTAFLEVAGSAEERLAAIAGSDKPNCLIVDFVGNSGRHKLMTSVDILGGKRSEEVRELAIRKARAAGERPLFMKDCLDEAEEELVRERERQKAEAEARRLQEAARKARLTAKVSYTSKTVNPFDLFDLTPNRVATNHGKALGPKQRNILLKLGVDPDKVSYAAARQLLDEYFRRMRFDLCTVKQAKVLRPFGYKVKNMGFKTASDLITKLHANGWRKIEESA